MRLVPLALIALALTSCQLSDTPGEQNPDDGNQSPAPTPTVSVSSHEPDVGVEFGVTFAVYPSLDYAVLDVLACSTGETIEHWAYDEHDELSPARDVTRTLSFEESRCLKIVYTAVEDGNDLPDTPVTLTVYVGGLDDDNKNDDDNGDDNDNHDDDNDDDSDRASPDPNVCDRIDWFNVTLSSGRHVEHGDTVDVDNGSGFSLNWGVQSVDDVDLSLSYEGDEFFSSDREEDSEYTNWDDHGEGTYTAVLDVEDNGDDCRQRIRFEATDDTDTGDGDDHDEGVLRIRVHPDGGSADDGDFRINVYDRDDGDDYAGALYDNQNRDTKAFPPGRYLLRIDSGPYDRYALDRVSGNCDPHDIGDQEARIRLVEGEERDCVFYMEYTGDDEDVGSGPNECEIDAGEGLAVCDESGDAISDGDVITLDGGDEVSIAWSASGVYSSTSLQVYNKSQGKDEFYSSVSEGSKTFVFPTEIPSGNIEVIFTVYRTGDQPASRYPVEFTLKSAN